MIWINLIGLTLIVLICVGVIWGSAKEKRK